jgi:hypothetical protein
VITSYHSTGSGRSQHPILHTFCKVLSAS